MAKRNKNYSADYVLYRATRKVRRSIFWMVISIFLFSFSLIAYIFSPIFHAFAIMFAVIMVILTFGLILLSKDFADIFNDTGGAVVSFIEKTSIGLMIFSLILFALSLLFYLVRRRRLLALLALAVTHVNEDDVIDGDVVQKSKPHVLEHKVIDVDVIDNDDPQ